MITTNNVLYGTTNCAGCIGAADDVAPDYCALYPDNPECKSMKTASMIKYGVVAAVALGVVGLVYLTRKR